MKDLYCTPIQLKTDGLAIFDLLSHVYQVSFSELILESQIDKLRLHFLFLSQARSISLTHASFFAHFIEGNLSHVSSANHFS